MICDGLLGGALSSSKVGFVFLVSNSTGNGFVYRSIGGVVNNPSAAGNGRSTTNSEAMMYQCLAGEACQAPPNADLAKSPHHC
jgi:hypothetical protein